MRKVYLLITVFLFVGVLGACGNAENNENESTNNVANQQENEVVNVDIENEETEANSEVEEVVESGAHSENIAITFLNVCFNGVDAENKSTVLDEIVDPEVRSIFDLSCAAGGNEIPNPSIQKSVNVDLNDGTKGEAHLITGDNGKEVIVLLRNEKIGWLYDNDLTDIKAEFGL